MGCNSFCHFSFFHMDCQQKINSWDNFKYIINIKMNNNTKIILTFITKVRCEIQFP